MRMVTLLSGRMPRPSEPGEVLASFTLAQENGIRVGSVLRPQLGTQAELEGAKVKSDPSLYGTYDLDQAADAVQASIRPQVIGWYVLAGLVALAALVVIGQAMARQTVAERAGQQALSALGVRPGEFAWLALLRALVTGAAGAAGAVLIAVLAVAALCATGVFGASLAHLISTPALYGAPFQAYFGSDGTPKSQAVVKGPLLDSLVGDPAIEQITMGAFVEVDVNGKHVRTVAMTPVRGAALLSALDGRLPRGDRDIMLGVATMHDTGARVGGTVRVTVADPDGRPHVASFHVIGRASLNAGATGLGKGAVMTTSAFVSAQCPAGPKQSVCRHVVMDSLASVILVRAAPGAAGNAALARHISALAAGVLAVANLLAAVPALLAARSDPARLLRAE